MFVVSFLIGFWLRDTHSRLGTLAAGSITSPPPGRPGQPVAVLGSALRSGVISPAHGLRRYTKKRPEPVRAQGEHKQCPWFHLNSRLADAHFLPGNGGDRRAISCPQLQRAFPPCRRRIFTGHPLSGPGTWGTVLCRRLFHILVHKCGAVKENFKFYVRLPAA